MKRDQLLRLALWIGILWSVNGTRRNSRLPTTWMVHLVGNTLLLGLPEIYRGLSRVLHLDARARRNPDGIISTGNAVMNEMVVENPRYAVYVTPVASAIIAAHPSINIYKADWAERAFFGLGLDSIPHSLTAFSLTHMVYDFLALPVVARRMPWATQHKTEISAGVLAAASLFYESGELAIHLQETKIIKDDPSKMAMKWSVPDTIQDLFANSVGWLAAVLMRRNR